MSAFLARPPFRRAEAGAELPDRVDGRIAALDPAEALSILCGVAAILDQAEREGISHGDLGVEFVTVGDGAVAVGGFGDPRNVTRAPEGKPRGTATDRYGLGVIAVQLLTRSLGRPKTDEDGPDDAVRPIPDIVGKIGGKDDAQALTIEIVDLLRPEPGERPDPLRVQAAALQFSRPRTRAAAPAGFEAPTRPPSIAPVPLAAVVGVCVAFAFVAVFLLIWALAG